MCKTYETIYELSKHVNSNILTCFLGHLKIEGELHKCDWNSGEIKCYDGIVTLKNAIISCPNIENQIKYDWINISSKQIQAFAYKCCEKKNETT